MFLHLWTINITVQPFLLTSRLSTLSGLHDSRGRPILIKKRRIPLKGDKVTCYVDTSRTIM